MSLGDGIVAATVLIRSAAAIFLVSKNRKWALTAKVIGALIAFFAVAVVGIWAYQQYEERPFHVISLAGVELGMSPVDAKIILGAPTREYQSKDNDGIVWTFQKSYSDGYDTYLRFEKNERGEHSLAIICDQNYPSLFGISSYTPIDKVIRKLGDPSHESIRSDGLQKILSYERWGTSFVIEKGHVIEICVTSGQRVVFIEPPSDSE